MRLPLDMIDGHVIARLESRTLLLDTGSPRSYSAAGTESLTIGGTTISFGAMPHHVSGLLQNIPCQIDLILGMDGCARFHVLMSTSTGELVLEKPIEATDNSAPTHQQVPSTATHGVPIIHVGMEAVQPVIFDTGAPVSYLDGPRLRNLGHRDDFYLSIGRFRTQIGHVLVDLGGRKVKLTAGEAPADLRGDLQAARVQGILGSELLTLADVALDSVGQRLLIQWHSARSAGRRNT